MSLPRNTRRTAAHTHLHVVLVANLSQNAHKFSIVQLAIAIFVQDHKRRLHIGFVLVILRPERRCQELKVIHARVTILSDK